MYEIKTFLTKDRIIKLPGIPDGCIDLIFNLDGNQRDCFFIPSPKFRQVYSFTPNTNYFGIRLLPLQTFFSFELSLKELNSSSSFPLFEVAPYLTNLYEKLLEAHTLQDRVHLLESFLLSKILKERTTSSIILNCIDQGIRHHGNIQAKQIESLTGYSQRYLRSLFTNELGISPKSFFQLINFQHIVNEIINNSFNLENYLNNNDFYDSSHFYKTFKKIAKMTPGEYIKLLKESKQNAVMID